MSRADKTKVINYLQKPKKSDKLVEESLELVKKEVAN